MLAVCAPAAACSGSAGAPDVPPRPHTRVIPWIATTRPLANQLWPVGGSVHAAVCRPADLRRGPTGMQGAPGELVGGVSVVNTSGHACTLRGPTRIALLTSDGAAIPTPATPDRAPQLQSLPRWPGYPIVSLRPHQQAFVEMRWSNYCGRLIARRVRVSWAGGTLVVQLQGGNRGDCIARGDPARLSEGWFIPASPPAHPKRPKLGISVSAPGHARPGQRIAYRVTLTNSSKEAVVFSGCPAYWQGMGFNSRQATTARHALVLNCRPTPTIGPDGHATYQMRFTVPPDTPVGRFRLEWRFEPLLRSPAGQTFLQVS